MKQLLLLGGWAMRPGVWDALAAHLPHFDCRRPQADWCCRGGPEGLADALAAELPPATVVVGWSLGAMVALQIARRHPQRCAALVLLAATPRFTSSENWPHGLPPELLQNFRSQLEQSPQALLQRFCGLQAQGETAPRGVLRALRSHAAGTDEAAALAAGLDLLAGSDLRPLLPQIQQPVLLLHGSDDSIVPPSAAYYCAQHLPRATLIRLAGMGHAPHVSNPALVAAFLQDWLLHACNG